MSNAALAPMGDPIQPGVMLAAKYRVERVIGRGGMGMVVEARHLELDERVALKFLLPEFTSHPEASERFAREARNAVKIKSEHVARVSDVGKLETGAPYMVMEYLEGSDLSGVLQTTGVLSIVDAVDYIIQGSEAIAEAHSLGIVHRDLKPANLFLSRRPDGSPIVKVLDFGISKSNGPGVHNLTKTTASMGSALYMSPEQMQQTRAVDHRTDIYALGISLYELLAGKQPFYAETLPQLCAAILTGIPQPIRELRQDVSPQLAGVIERAYARDRGQRYPSVGEFVMALAPFAPARSYPIIERVARLAGLPVPQLHPALGVWVAAVPPWPAAPLPSAPLPESDARSTPLTAPFPATEAMTMREASPHAEASWMAIPPLPVLNQIVPEPYEGPLSSRAAATFANATSSRPLPLTPSKKRPMMLWFLPLLLIVVGTGGVMAMKRAKPASSAEPVVASMAPPPVASVVARPPEPPMASPTASVSSVAVASPAASVPSVVAPTASGPSWHHGGTSVPAGKATGLGKSTASPPSSKKVDPLGHM